MERLRFCLPCVLAVLLAAGVCAGRGGDPAPEADAGEREAALAAQLKAEIEQSYLAEATERISQHRKPVEWPEAAQLAADPKYRLITTPAEWPSLRRQVIDVGKRTLTLDALERALGEPSAAPEKAADAFRKVKVGSGQLIKEATRPVTGLAALSDLRAAWERPAAKPPDAGAVERLVKELEAAVPEVSPLGAVIRQDFSVKAFLDNDPALALKLLPKDGPADHAAALLDDVKALALGEGGVKTAPVAWVVERQPGRGAPPVRGPPTGVAALLPSDARAGSPVTSAAAPRASPLSGAAALEEQLRKEARNLLDTRRPEVAEQAALTFKEIDRLGQDVRTARADKEKFFKELPSLNPPELSSVERVFAWELHSNGKPSGEIAAAIDQYRLERPTLPDGDPNPRGADSGEEPGRTADRLSPQDRSALAILDAKYALVESALPEKPGGRLFRAAVEVPEGGWTFQGLEDQVRRQEAVDRAVQEANAKFLAEQLKTFKAQEERMRQEQAQRVKQMQDNAKLFQDIQKRQREYEKATEEMRWSRERMERPRAIP